MQKNKLQIHPNRSKYMINGSSYNLKNKVSSNPILINKMPIPRVNKYKCLRVTMDERLSWEEYINSVCCVVSSRIGAMKRVKPFLPMRTLKMLYNAIIPPYFDYCSPLWDNCGIGLKERLQTYPNRAARVITESTYDIRSSDLLEKLNWKSLVERRKYLKSIFIYKILNGHSAPNLQDAFCLHNNRDNIYNLRNSETDLAESVKSM